MEELDVPSFYLCPISFQIMKDPVTVSTGITYDRESIEKWLYFNKKNTCPVTKQVLSDHHHLTPNHTLRRLIQSWCTVNSSYGIERIPTPKPPIDKTQITKLISNARSPLSQLSCLEKLRSIAAESESNKRCIEDSGAVEFLASIVSKYYSINNSSSDQLQEGNSDEFSSKVCDEALSILYNLNLSEKRLKSLAADNNGDFIGVLTKVMQRGSYKSRAYATMSLKSVLEFADPTQLAALKVELFSELVRNLNDQISQQASKDALQMLIDVCPRGRNRVKAVEAGGISVLIELLLSSTEKRINEMTLMALELLCGCADGRSEFLEHAAGLAVVSKKILRVSKVGSERAVRILYLISKFSACHSFLQEMLQLGVVAKLCLLIQVDCGSKLKEKARVILKLHARVWRNSSCIPLNFLSSYPS